MLIDANELAEDSCITCDICIAGSGPAGMTIARELAHTRLQVCLIESGGLSPQNASPAFNIAEQLGIPLDPLQRHCFGGASNWWGGMRGTWFRSKPLDPIDFEARPWVPNSGWPVNYDELVPLFERARDTLNVPHFHDLALEAVRERLAPEFCNGELHTTIFQMSRPMRFGRHYRSLFLGSRNVRIYLHSRVVEIVEDPSSPVVRHLHVATDNGRSHRVLAKHFVLACGGLENTRLLLASKRKAESGIGNEHDLVGRYYMQHPKGLCGVAFLNRKSLRTPLYTRGCHANGVKLHGGISFSEELQRRENLLNHCVWFKPIFSLSESHAALAFRAAHRAWHDSECFHFWQREFLDHAIRGAKVFGCALRDTSVSTVFAVSNHMEEVPTPESRLDLSERRDQFGVPQLRTHWRIDPLAKESLCRLHKLVNDKLAFQRVGRLESDLDPFADGWPVSADAAHHLGTTRMHADPKRGVTDSHGRVHGVHNLYISGGSVFPTSGHANPTLTIVALAIRLADHLKGL